MSTGDDLFSGFSEEMKSVLSRVNILSAEVLSTDSAIAREFGINRGNPAQWRKRGTTPFDIFINYAKEKKINIHWLLTGEGEPSLSKMSADEVEQHNDNAQATYLDDKEADQRVLLRAQSKLENISDIIEKLEEKLTIPKNEHYETIKTMLIKLATKGDCEQEEFNTFVDYFNNQEFAMIPGYNIQVSAGHGSVNGEKSPTRYLAFRYKWLKYRGFNEKDLVVVFAKGDSMEPTIANNNSLLIQTKVESIQDGAIYVVRNDDTLLVKRVQRLLDGNLKLISDNPTYDSIVLTKEDFESLNVVGQVVWIAKDIG